MKQRTKTQSRLVICFIIACLLGASIPGNAQHDAKKVQKDIEESQDFAIEPVRQTLDDPPYDTGCELLIITPQEFIQAAEMLAEWKNEKGIPTWVITTQDTGETAAEIRAYIQNAFFTWDPIPFYVLLLGDVEFIPINYETPYPATDLLYVTTHRTGITNFEPDLAIGRISVDTLSQANTVIQKILDYEQHPQAAAEFYSTTAVVSYFQDNNQEQWPPDGYEDCPWIQISEEIRTYLLLQGYSAADRIYYANPERTPTYFNDQTPLPEELLRPTFAWDGDAADITAAFQSGRFLINHLDHGISRNDLNSLGEFDGWVIPQYTTDDVALLTNANNLPIVFSMGCDTGWFDGETDVYETVNYECFAEELLRKPAGGAIGVVAGTRTSGGSNDLLCKGLFDAIWPDFDPSHGDPWPYYRMGDVLNAARMYLAEVNHDPNACRSGFSWFNLHGDPTMEIWTAQPEALTVTHPPGMNTGTSTMTVHVQSGTTPVSNAYVCLWKDGDLYLTGYTDATGDATFAVTAATEGQISVTVTKHNYIPYQGIIYVDDAPPRSRCTINGNVMTLSATDQLSGVSQIWYCVVGQDIWWWVYSEPVSFPSGHYEVRYYAVDRAGNSEPLNTEFLDVQLQITVPDEYLTIQEAIDNARHGDRVFVRSGTYTENIIIASPISLVGENPDTTIIDGGGNGNVITVSTSEVTIQGFTIQNSDQESGAGISIELCDSNTITNNIITQNNNGMYLRYSSQNTITQNTISENDVGIQLFMECLDNTISQNSFAGGINGLLLITRCSGNIITENQFTDAQGSGLTIFQSRSNIVYHNNFNNNFRNAVEPLGLDGEPFLNIWCSPDITEGNYWDDYTGGDADFDGVGEEAYDIWGDSPSQDLYPLLYPYAVNMQGAIEVLLDENSFLYCVITTQNGEQLEPTFLSLEYWCDGLDCKFSGLLTNVENPHGHQFIELSCFEPRATIIDEYAVVRYNSIEGGFYYLDMVDSNTNYYAGNLPFRYCIDGLQVRISGDICTYLVPFMFGTPFFITNIESLDEVIYVNDNAAPGGDGSYDQPYQFIQDGINAAGSDDLVFVCRGNYHITEPLIIDEPLTIIGEAHHSTIFADTFDMEDMLLVTADHVTVRLLTFRGPGEDQDDQTCAIHLNANDATITDNVIGILTDFPVIEMRYGIKVSDESNHNIIARNTIQSVGTAVILCPGSHDTVLSENTLYYNQLHGIELSFSSHNTIQDNYIIANEEGDGVYLSNSDDNIIQGNIASFNEWFGIHLYYSTRNVIRENKVEGNFRGFYIENWDENPTTQNSIYHNNIIDNTVNDACSDDLSTWDNGYPSGGNYWSNYDASHEGAFDRYHGVNQDIPGSDGVVDSANPHTLGRDHYPLMQSYGSANRIYNYATDKRYRTVQDAIDDQDTLPGHTILIQSGVYYENIVINKAIRLVGQNREQTIIDGSNQADVIQLTVNGVNLSNVTIRNQGGHTGINIQSNANTITRTTIKNTNYGIVLQPSTHHNTISNNVLTDNGECGITLQQQTLSNTIKKNTITYSTIGAYGINMHQSQRNTILGNTITHHLEAIYVHDASDNNGFSQNIFSSNGYGIHIDQSNGNNIKKNTFSSSSQDNAYETNGRNQWEYNYWDDYSIQHPNPVDANRDNIWDGTYAIPTNGLTVSFDHYPMVIPFNSRIHVLNPNGGETWYLTPPTQVIQWESIGMEGERVNIYLTLKPGSERMLLAENVESLYGLNTFNWVAMPPYPPASTRCQIIIEVTSTPDGPSDASDECFIITGNPTNPLVVVTPNGGETWRRGSTQHITWESEITIDKTYIQYSTDNGDTWKTINAVPTKTGINEYTWFIPKNTPGSSKCLIQIIPADPIPGGDVSDKCFTIK